MKPVKTYTNGEPHYVTDNPMNAYELADEAEKAFMTNTSQYFAMPLINLVRQQADQLDKVIPQLVKANGLIENLRIRIKELEDVLSTYELRDLNNTSRIADLEKQLSIMEGEYPEPTVFAKIIEFNSLEEAYNRIAELEKLVEEIKYEKSSGVYDVSSKPVAWMQKDVLPLTYIIKAVVRREADEQYTIPLYTHPVKQLSDELKALLNSVNGDCYLGKEQEEKLVAIIRKQYAHPIKQLSDGCGNCHACLVGVMENLMPVTSQRMICCPDCGNKRCPKASNHRYQCTESNKVGQRGSIYTHPVKQLSDEEIDEIIKQHDWFSKSWVDMVRAIERKITNG